MTRQRLNAPPERLHDEPVAEGNVSWCQSRRDRERKEQERQIGRDVAGREQEKGRQIGRDVVVRGDSLIVIHTKT